MSDSDRKLDAGSAQAETASEARVDGSQPMPSQDVPSIIVDPKLRAEARTMHKPVGEASDTGARRRVGAGAAQPTPAEGGQLSGDDADRFADSIRPSWEPPPPGEPEPATATPAAESQGVAAIRQGRHTWLDDTQDRVDLPRALPTYGLLRQRNLLMAAAASVGIVLVIWMSMAAQPDEKPEPWDIGDSTAKSPPAPASEPEKQAAAVDEPPVSTSPQPGVQPESPASGPMLAKLDPGAGASQSAQATPDEPADKGATGQDPASLPESASRQTAAAEPRPAAPASAAAEKARPRKVHIQVTTSPASARLSLDGSPVANPFDAWMAPSGRHEFRAEAAGHKKVWRLVDFAEDQTVLLNLPSALRESTGLAGSKRPATRATTASRKVRARRKQGSTSASRRQATRRPAVRKSRAGTASRRKSRDTSSRGAGFVTESPF